MTSQQTDDQVVTEDIVGLSPVMVRPEDPGMMGCFVHHIIQDAATHGILYMDGYATWRLVGIVSHPDSRFPVDKIADAVGDGAIKVKCKKCRAVLAVFRPGALDVSVGVLNVVCPVCGTHRRIIPPKPKGLKP